MSHARQVFFNCNSSGIMPISVAVYSLLRTARSDRSLIIHLAHDTKFAELSGCERVRAIVGRFPFAQIRFADFEPVYARHADLLDSALNGWSPMVWAWMFCTELFPDLTGNLVFIDWDMFVRKDLSELFDLDLASGNWMSAALSESTREDRPELVSTGWPETCESTVTTALQVINTDAFRRERARERMLEWYAAHKDVARCVEQDCLSMVYGPRILRLPPKFNCPVGWLARVLKDNFLRPRWRVFDSIDVLEALVDPAIVHFIGLRKPWRYNHRPWRNDYRKAMIELRLIDRTLPGETPTKRIIGSVIDLYNAGLRAYARILLKIASRNRQSASSASSRRCG